MLVVYLFGLLVPRILHCSRNHLHQQIAFFLESIDKTFDFNENLEKLVYSELLFNLVLILKRRAPQINPSHINQFHFIGVFSFIFSVSLVVKHDHRRTTISNLLMFLNVKNFVDITASILSMHQLLVFDKSEVQSWHKVIAIVPSPFLLCKPKKVINFVSKSGVFFAFIEVFKVKLGKVLIHRLQNIIHFNPSDIIFKRNLDCEGVLLTKLTYLFVHEYFVVEKPRSRILLILFFLFLVLFKVVSAAQHQIYKMVNP